jgi:cell wall-associated NlpC family hydrolase
MEFGICNVPVSPLRAEASHRSEMTSQLLFGELCETLEEDENWKKVRCKYDDYTGWLQSNQVISIDETVYFDETVHLTAEWVTEILYNGLTMKIPMGSLLTGFEKGMARWNDDIIKYKGKDWNFPDPSPENIINKALEYLNTPYLWGGKTVFGIDCSGFVQAVFRFFQVQLLRDTFQQADQGESVIHLEMARRGDLAFFDNASGKIIHVGILLNDHEIIHASGKVRVDGLTSEGIINTDTDKQTHRLKLIRRVL